MGIGETCIQPINVKMQDNNEMNWMVRWNQHLFIYLYKNQELFLTVKREKTLKSMQKIDMLQCTRLKYPE